MSKRNDKEVMVRHGDTVIASLWYPRNDSDDVVRCVMVGMYDVRAADDILIEYDFERDGYSIKQASIFKWDFDDEEMDADWQEVAFVKAWQREVQEE